MRDSFEKWSRPKRIRTVILLAIYAILLTILVVLVGSTDTPEEKQTFGSLEGRFESDITIDSNGETYHYRENEITNYLIIGVDKQSVNEVTNHQHGGQADFLLLLSVDRINRCITPVMLDRDTMVEIQTYGVFGHPSGMRILQLCLAQAYSGVNMPGSINTVQTVEKLLHGVVIDHYVTLDVTAIPLLNDAIGGVEVTLEDDFTSFDPSMTAGTTIRLKGKQAEFFARGRMTVADGTNASRMARQQQYLSSFLAQFRALADDGELDLGAILDSLDGHMISDASEDTLIHDVDAYYKYDWRPLQMISGEHRIDKYGYAEYWLDEAELMRLILELWFT